MARAPVRTLFVIVIVVAIALLIRWTAGDWLWSQLRSMHGR